MQLAAPFQRAALVVALLAALLASGCVYRVDVQQGNLLEDEDIRAVELGMTRSQVRFLLGTPVAADSFHQDRWDYIYYYRGGRASKPEKRWVVVEFDRDRVWKIRWDVPLGDPDQALARNGDE